MPTSGSDHTMITYEQLQRFIQAVLEHGGLPSDQAELVAETLAEADLRGVHSHGSTLLGPYYKRLTLGGVNIRPHIRTVRETECLTLLDGDEGMGQVVSAQAMQMAIDKAKNHGLGATVVGNSNHFGAAAYWAMMALPHQMIGFATTNANAIMAPWGGITPSYGNNPPCFAIPADQEYPIVLDMACSVVAWGKIMLASKRGEDIPSGWATDIKGRPTQSPAEAIDGLLTPIGDYKGYGMAVVMDVLTGVLSGGLFGLNIPQKLELSETQGSCHLFGALQVERMMPIAEFKQRVDTYVQQLKSSELAEGFHRIYLPGEIEFENRKERLRDGIPLGFEIVRDLRDLADQLGMAFPSPPPPHR